MLKKKSLRRLILGTLLTVVILGSLLPLATAQAAGTTTYTVVLQPGPGNNDGLDNGGADNGKDAWVQYDRGRISGSGIAPSHWTQWPSNFSAVGYGLYQFDVASVVPAKAQVVEAELVLHHFFNSSAGSTWYAGNEVFILESIGASWDEMTVNWSNKPAADSFFSTTIMVSPNPVPSTRVASLDITPLVIGWLTGAEANNGFIYRMNDSGFYNRQDHYVRASDFEVVEQRPALVITYTIENGDDTPPVITPEIKGTMGNDGWYISDVQVSWTVTDEESDLTEVIGAETTLITEDTDGVTLTCTATSDGGTATESVTVKRDATAPEIIIAVPADGAEFLIGQAITAEWSVTDALSGVGETSADTVSTATAGTQIFTVTATDLAGNTAQMSSTYYVLTAGDAIQRLIIKVKGLELQQGIEQGLVQTLEAALKSYNKDNLNATSNQLKAFVNHSLALPGKKISESNAAEISADALAIIAILNQ